MIREVEEKNRLESMAGIIMSSDPSFFITILISPTRTIDVATHTKQQIKLVTSENYCPYFISLYHSRVGWYSQ